MNAIPILQDCGKNILCRIEETIRSIGADLASLFDTAVDYLIPVFLLILGILVLVKGFQRIRQGDTWQAMSAWLWNNWVLLAIILLFGAGVIVALVGAYTDVFDRAGDAIDGFLRTR